MDQPITIYLAGGGTGGHLYPGLAVADALRSSLPGANCVFVCTEREIDRVILQEAGFEFIPQPIVPPRTSIGGLLKFWKSWRETKDLLRATLKQRWPAVVVGLGGYAAGAAVRMAAHRNISTVILNPDLIPGKANQFLMKHARAVCCQFPQTADHIAPENRSKLHVTGCPIRSQILTARDRPAALTRLDLQPGLKTLVITGASLGAKTVNDAVLAVLAELAETSLLGWQVLHLAGRDHAADVRAGYLALPAVRSRVIDFTPAMADVWAVADLCVSRSGASSCAELTACGVPGILMPYPFHKDLHQRANAAALADAGAAILLDDEKDRRRNASKLKPILDALLSDPSRRLAMSAAAAKLGRPQAAVAVADVIRGMVPSAT